MMMRRLYILIYLFALLVSQVSAGQKVDGLVVFGDSLSDPGNAFALLGDQSLPPYLLIPEAPYAIGGHHFSNGRTWVEKLGHEFGVNAGPAFSPQGGFNNYAIGGARARSFGQIYLSMQVATYLGRNSGKAPAGNLYAMFIGGNDVRDAIESFAIDPSGALAAQIIGDALAAVGDNLNALASAGGRQFLVLNLPDLALVPAIRLQGAQAQQVANYLSSEYNKGLTQVLSTLQAVHKIDIKSVDIFDLLHQVVANPEEFDLTNVQDSCITPGVIEQAVCTKPKDYLFWDGIHPTRTVHKLIAEVAHESFAGEKKHAKKEHHKHPERREKQAYAAHE